MSTTTDILDIELPQPAWAMRPHWEGNLHSDLTFSRSSAGRMWDPVQQKYVSRAVDVPRYAFDESAGVARGLLVEGASRTNQVEHSSGASEWTGGDVNGADKTSVIDGEVAQELTPTSTSANRRIPCGSIGGTGAMYLILEKGGAGENEFKLRDQTNNSDIITGAYNWSQDTISFSVGPGLVQAKDSRELLSSGPNGQPVRIIALDMDGLPGTNGRMWLYPDRVNGSDSVIHHHAQFENAPNVTTPIVTGPSSVTRGGEDYTISVGGWWNGNGGTFLVEVEPRYYTTEDTVGYLAQGTNRRYIYMSPSSDGLRPLISDGNNSFAAPSQGNMTPFEVSRVGAAFGNGEMIISSNGYSGGGTHNGNLTDKGDIRLNLFDNVVGSHRQIIYFPTKLPASTLNELTR